MTIKSVLLRLKDNKSREGLLVVVFVALVLLFQIVSGGRFIRSANITSIFYQVPEFGIFTIGMYIVILTGGINLSLIMLGNLSVGLAAVLLNRMISLENTNAIIYALLLIALSFCIAIVGGGLNGSLAAYLDVEPILVTLGSLALFEGLILVLTKGGSISLFPNNYDLIGGGSIFGLIPFSFLLMLVLYFFWYDIFKNRVFGAQISAVGSSPKVAAFSGINVKRILLMVYIFSAILGCIASLIMSSRYNSIKETYGLSYLLQSVAAVILGGASIYGGKGSIVATFISVMIFQVISSGFSIIGVNRYLTAVLAGLILLIALFQKERVSSKK